MPDTQVLKYYFHFKFHGYFVKILHAVATRAARAVLPFGFLRDSADHNLKPRRPDLLLTEPDLLAEVCLTPQNYAESRVHSGTSNIAGVGGFDQHCDFQGDI